MGLEHAKLDVYSLAEDALAYGTEPVKGDPDFDSDFDPEE